MEEIQEQIAIYAKMEIKVQKKERNKSPNRKGEIKVQIKYGKKNMSEKEKSFLRSRCKTAIKNVVFQIFRINHTLIVK